MKKIEKRETPITTSSPTLFVGKAAVYNVKSKYGLRNEYSAQPFKEIFLPGCFAESIATDNDVLALSDHISVSSTLLGRKSAGTLRLVDTPESLQFEIDIPDTTQGRDISTQIQRGDIKGVSLGMIVFEDEYINDPEDNLLLRIVKKAHLSEISLVVSPAYSATKVEVREMKQEVSVITDSVDTLEVEQAEVDLLNL